MSASKRSFSRTIFSAGRWVKQLRFLSWNAHIQSITQRLLVRLVQRRNSSSKLAFQLENSFDESVNCVCSAVMIMELKSNESFRCIVYCLQIFYPLLFYNRLILLRRQGPPRGRGGAEREKCIYRGSAIRRWPGRVCKMDIISHGIVL